MDTPPKKILVLTADAGFGHRSAANAVVSAMQEKYGEQCQIELLNPLEDKRTPFFLRDSQSDYDKIVRSVPELYRFGYDASDAVVPSAIFESALTVLLYEVMSDLVRSYQPDVILTTYPLYQAPLEAVFAINRRQVPLVTVITDLVSIHRIWFNPSVTACLVPNQTVRELAINYGLPPQIVQVTGIPVNPEVVRDHRTPEEVRGALGWRTDLPTLLAVGSRRVERLVDTLGVLNHFGMPLQLAVVCGKDEDLYRELRGMDWHVPVHLYEYVDNVPTMMHAADGLICKAGGLIITEALAVGLPLMLIDVIPGQETGNADFVVQNGAGDMALSTQEVLETTAHWMLDYRRLLKLRAENVRRLGKPNAAYAAADMLWSLAQEPNHLRRRFSTRPRLIDLLNSNKVPWQGVNRPHSQRRHKPLSHE